MAKTRVLFVCVQNSARSQMAEAWLNHLAGDRFDVHSAGLEPGVLNPLAAQVMQEAGIDISQNETKSVLDLSKTGELYSYVITVCDQASAEKCPVFPGPTKRLAWSFEDPGTVAGTDEEKLQKVRTVRDQIKAAVEELCRHVT